MDWNLIHKFLSNQCSPAERQKVGQWLSENPGRRAFMDSMRKIWDVNPKQEGNVDVQAAWRRFQASRMKPQKKPELKPMGKTVAPEPPVPASQLAWYQKTPIYAAAAAVLLLVVVFFVARTQFGEPAKVTYQQITTANGEKTSLTLGDGTRVMLNAASSLKIPSNYGKKDRTLYLQGEAFFTVADAPSKSFRVYAGEMYTEDLGTEFNLQAFPEDSTLAVVVTEGKVVLGAASGEKESPVLVSSHEKGVVTSNGDLRVEKLSDLSAYIGWTRETLVFNDTPFREVLLRLERWYGVECLVRNERLLDQKLTATFTREPLANVLKLISKSMDIDANIKKKTVVFSARKAE